MLEQYGCELHVQFKQDADFSLHEVLDDYIICGWLHLQIWNHGHKGRRNSEETCEAETVSEGERRGGEGRGVTGADYARPCGLWENFAIYK